LPRPALPFAVVAAFVTCGPARADAPTPTPGGFAASRPPDLVAPYRLPPARPFALRLLAEKDEDEDDPTTVEPRPEVEPEAGLPYALALQGPDGQPIEGELADGLKGVSLLLSKTDRPPASRAALIRRVEEDVERFRSYLKAEGYYAYSVDHRIAFAEAPAEVTVTVDPGPRYTLAAFDIVYDAPEAPGLVVDPARIGVTVGDPARAEPIVEAPPRLIRRLGERGFPLAKVKQRKSVVDHASREMRTTIEVAEGPRVVFGETRVTGLDRVDADYVVRVADLSPGEHFDLARVDAARRRLFATGLFEGLQLEWADTPDEIGRLDVLIEAQERDPRTISVGLNYSTTEGAGADVSWTHRNIFGQDEDLTFTLRAAELEQSLTGELSAPNFWRLDQRVFLSGEVARETTDAFEERRIKTETGISRKVGERWRVGGGGELSLQETIENDETEQTILFGFPFFATYDGSDDPFDPTKGYKLDFRVEPAAITLDTTDVFATFTAGGSAYRKLTSDRTLIAAARAKAGYILGSTLDRIPASRRLYSGGGGSIRGYQFQSVSPLDSDGEPDGGRSLVEFGAELRWRITEDIGIVPFVDGGGAFRDAAPDFNDLQYAAGLGLRYYTPIGPLRLDVATPLNPRDDDNIIEVYISIGQAF